MLSFEDNVQIAPPPRFSLERSKMSTIFGLFSTNYVQNNANFWTSEDNYSPPPPPPPCLQKTKNEQYFFATIPIPIKEI